MERIWKQGGLDLRLSCYCCLPTGQKEGIIQMVPEAETICRIQMQAGGLLGLNIHSNSNETMLEIGFSLFGQV
jgi:hypothetical protein